MYGTTREPAPLDDFERIRLGDVGYIRRGCFNLLFSAGRPLGERALGTDVPGTFEQLHVGPILRTEPQLPGCFSAGGVREIQTRTEASMYPCVCSIASVPSRTSNVYPSMLEPRSSISFHLIGDQGAALLTKHSIFSEDIQRWGTFEGYTKEHYDSWVAFARACGHGNDIKPVLVTGVDVTRDFAMMSYLNDSGDLTAEFKTSVSGVVSPWGTWRKPGTVYTNCGPQPRRPPSATQTVDPEPSSSRHTETTTRTMGPEPSGSDRTGIVSDAYHQCVFVRYYTVRKRLGIPRVVKAAAGPHDLGPGDRDDQMSPLVAQCKSESSSDAMPSPFDNGGDDDRSSVTSIDSDSDVVIHNTATVGSSPFLPILVRPIEPL